MEEHPQKHPLEKFSWLKVPVLIVGMNLSRECVNDLIFSGIFSEVLDKFAKTIMRVGRAIFVPYHTRYSNKSAKIWTGLLWYLS